MTDKTVKFKIGCGCLYLFIWVAGFIGIVYVAVHFISKYW